MSRTRPHADARPDRGPFFGYALPYAGDSELVPPGHARRDPPARRGCSTAPATRSPTRSSSSGRPTPTAQVVAASPGSLRRDGFTFTGWGRARHRRRRALLVHHVRPGRPTPARRRSSRSPSSRAACSTGCSPAPTCPGRRGAGRRPAARRASTRTAARRWSRAADEHGFRLRHPAAGRGRDRLPRLSATLTGMSGPLLARRRARRRPAARTRRCSRRWSPSRRPGSRAGRRRHRARRRPRHDLHGLVGAETCRAAGRGRRGRRQPGRSPLVALLRDAARATQPRGGPLAAPRPDQPGRRRHAR